MQGILVFHFRDDEVTKIVAYYNRERGLADLGLDPEGNPADTPGPSNGSG
jgi:hypothetical protein